VRIFHIATTADWQRAQSTGSYTTSTYGASLAEVGYLHAAQAEQVNGVLARYYADVDEPLVILEIESDLLASPWREDEVGHETFPHIYGPLNVAAVVTTWAPPQVPGQVAPTRQPPRPPPPALVVAFRGLAAVLGRASLVLLVFAFVAHQRTHPGVIQDAPSPVAYPSYVEFLAWMAFAASAAAAFVALLVAILLRPLPTPRRDGTR
jgi:uncharacterized protein (DUF952 family)